MILKHPLEQEWTFWYYYPEKRQSWSANQKMVLTVSTVEGFWAVYNNILQPSQLKVNSDYSLFKSGIKPDWEDLGNIHGGRWVTTCPRERLDVGWKELVMALIGEQMGDGLRDTVTGAVVNVRSKGDKLAVWVGDDSDLVEASVGVHISRILGLYEMRRLEYKRFKP